MQKFKSGDVVTLNLFEPHIVIGEIIKFDYSVNAYEIKVTHDTKYNLTVIMMPENCLKICPEHLKTFL
jgi:hypothetical protein